MFTGVLLGDKAVELWINHPPPYSAKVKNKWNYFPPIFLHDVEKKNFFYSPQGVISKLLNKNSYIED